MEVVYKLDLVKIDNHDFKELFNLFRTVVDLCPTDARHRLSTEDLDAVDSCLVGMSRIEGSRRTDDSEMETDFALSVIGACFLLADRELPETDGLPTPDILYEGDALSKAEVNKHEADNGRISYKDALQEHAELLEKAGKMSSEAKNFSRGNFTLVDGAIPIWLLDLIEEVVTARRVVPKGKTNPVGTLKKYPLFQHLVKGKSTEDPNRKLIDCGQDWVLYNLIAFPVSRKLEVLGFLMNAADSSESRIAKVVTYIESIAGNNAHEPREKRDQSWHTDFSSLLAKYFDKEVGISVLVGATEGSEVHVIAGTFGLESTDELRQLVMNGNVEKVVIRRGQCLVMEPGLRHKGVGYNERNVRLFLAFLVGRSVGASFGNTYDLDDKAAEKFFVGLVRSMFKWMQRRPCSK